MVYQLLPQQDPEVKEKFSVSTVNGAAVLNLIAELDYETRNLYEVQIEARDRAGPQELNTAVATVIVKVIFFFIDEGGQRIAKGLITLEGWSRCVGSS